MEIIADILLRCLDLQTLGIFTTVFLSFVYLLSPRGKLPPGPPGYPIIGNLLLMMSIKPGTRYDFYRGLAKKYGNICRIRFGARNMFLLSGYDTVHEALVTFGNVFGNRPNWLHTITMATKNGRGVIFANGKEWKALRRMSLITLRGFGVGKQTIEERIKDEVKAIIDVLEEKSRQPFHIKYYLSRAITNITCSILFGHRFDYDDPKFKELLDALEIYFKMENTSSPINALPWLRYLPTKRQGVSTIMAPIKVWSEFTADQVEKHKETFDTNNIRDFIDVYLQTKEALEEDDDIITAGNIFRMILDLFGAGTETTATSLDWVFLYMIGYPEIQRKCQEEIASVVGTGCSVSLADRRKLPYVHATLNEIQRICNVAPTTIPHGLTEDVIFQGYSLPKHSIIIIDLMSVHKDPKYWQDPHLFKPERFLDRNGQLICRKGFMPFSEGPRECLGESLARSELFLIFSNLLQWFDFTCVHGNEVNFHGFHGKTLSPKPYELNIVPR